MTPTERISILVKALRLIAETASDNVARNIAMEALTKVSEYDPKNPYGENP